MNSHERDGAEVQVLHSRSRRSDSEASLILTITGEGDCEVSAEEKLIVDIRGAGNVYYKGNPVLDATVTGTGQIIFVE